MLYRMSLEINSKLISCPSWTCLTLLAMGFSIKSTDVATLVKTALKYQSIRNMHWDSVRDYSSRVTQSSVGWVPETHWGWNQDSVCMDMRWMSQRHPMRLNSCGLSGRRIRRQASTMSQCHSMGEPIYSKGRRKGKPRELDSKLIKEQALLDLLLNSL